MIKMWFRQEALDALELWSQQDDLEPERWFTIAGEEKQALLEAMSLEAGGKQYE